MRCSTRTDEFIKAGVTKKNMKDKRFKMKRKHCDKRLKKRNITCFKVFDTEGDCAIWDMTEFAFDHWDPRGVLHSRNEKGAVESHKNIHNFIMTDDVRATTLKHRQIFLGETLLQRL